MKKRRSLGKKPRASRAQLTEKAGRVLPLVACGLFTLAAFVWTCWGSLRWLQAHRGPASLMIPAQTRLASVLEGTFIPGLITIGAFAATLFYWHRHKRFIRKTLRSLNPKS